MNGYYFRVPFEQEFQSSAKDPQDGLDKLLEGMRGEDLQKTIPGDIVVELFEHGPRESYELFDQILSQIEGGLILVDEDPDILPETLDVMYKLGTDENYFETINKGAPAGTEEEIGRILRDEGFKVKKNH